MNTLAENYETVKGLPVQASYTAELTDRGATLVVREETLPRLMLRVAELSCFWGCHLRAIY